MLLWNRFRVQGAYICICEVQCMCTKSKNICSFCSQSSTTPPGLSSLRKSAQLGTRHGRLGCDELKKILSMRLGA